jgi:hypothetical protein
MPGTIAEQHVGTVTVEAIEPVDVRDLTGSERAVALYASDMPSGRRRHADEQVRAWIVQGVGRLGMEELRRRALFLRGWRLLDLDGLVTPQVQARHEQRFPKPGRLAVAESEGAGSVLVDGVSDAARLRNGTPIVDGGCPCRGTGGIPLWEPGIELMCPVHSRSEIDAFHRGYGAGA